MAADSARVLLISRNLPPLVGGMERLLHNTALGIAEYAELTVIGPKGCADALPAGIEVIEAPKGLVGFLPIAMLHALACAVRKSPDVILGGSGLTAPILWFAGKLARARTLVFLHGLDLVVPHPAYQWLFPPFIRRLDGMIANSENTRNIAIDKGVEAARIAIVHPGTDLPEPADGDAINAFHEAQAIRFERFLLFTGRQTRRKGLSRFLQHCMPAILEHAPDIGLVVVGENPRDSLNRLGEQDAILAAINAGGLADKVQFLGVVDDRTLQLCYACAALQVFPLVDVPGDVEGFGMVAVEAAANGTPTVAFDLGGVADAISADSGALVPPGNYDAFARAVMTLLESPPDAANCRRHAEGFAWPAFHARLRPLVEGNASIPPAQ